jgi:hypothetical protein
LAGVCVRSHRRRPPDGLTTDEHLAVLAFDLEANGLMLDQKLDLDLAETLTIPR